MATNGTSNGADVGRVARGRDRRGRAFDGFVLEAARRLIQRGVYPSAAAVAPLAGVRPESARRIIRRLRRDGLFPTELPPIVPPHVDRGHATARRVADVYRAILADGRIPTTRQIAAAVGVCASTASKHQRRLRAAGALPPVPDDVLEADRALINRVRDRTLYEAILKVHSIDCAKNPPESRMTHSLIAREVGRLLDRHVSDDQVRRYLNATGYWRCPQRRRGPH